MRKFWSDRRGNVALIFALVAVPLLGVMGSAVDYAMASAYRADIQKALDATALALTKIMPANQETLNTVGNHYFQANLKDHDLENLQLNIVPDVGVLRVSASGTYRARMASIIGASTIDLGASAEAKWSIGKVEVALVLDSSLSMNDLGKIQALRTAAVDLINVLENASRNPGDAKIAIVPFDGMINTGYTYANRPAWVSFDWWDDHYGDCSKDGSSYNSRSACESQFVCTKNYSSQSRCINNGGNWVPATWTPDGDHDDWNGCVYDRTQNHDVSDDAPTSASTYYPAAKCFGTPPQAVTPLTEDWGVLRSRATNLTPTGYTNITIGLTWGWHVLSPTELFSHGAAYDTDDLTKYIVLMTDGYNTKASWKEPNICPLQGPCPDIDMRTEAACTNIKTAGIKIYAIRLVDGNADLLRDCATNANMYYDVQNASQLSGVFSAIGSEIASLHLSR